MARTVMASKKFDRAKFFNWLRTNPEDKVEHTGGQYMSIGGAALIATGVIARINSRSMIARVVSVATIACGWALTGTGGLTMGEVNEAWARDELVEKTEVKAEPDTEGTDGTEESAE